MHKLLHYGMTEATMQGQPPKDMPVEYVVIVDDDDPGTIEEYLRTDYEFKSSADLDGMAVDMMPIERPLWPTR